MSDRVDKFHAHLDECERCRDNPFDLCPKGYVLLTEVVPEEKFDG